MNTRWIPLPGKIRSTLQLLNGILFQYGWLRSLRQGKAFDKSGNPIPWFTYPAIDFIKQFDFTDKKVFEWGAGQSTLFWCTRAQRVVSIESNPEWHAYLEPMLPANCELILCAPENETYVQQIERYPDGFDVIVVDGTWPGRLPGSRLAPSYLKRGGMIILDNSDQCLESGKALRESGLTQIDFTGFVPGNGYAQTTSVFFDGQYSLKPIGSQPQMSVAQPNPPWPNA